jgi:hypothetical protein
LTTLETSSAQWQILLDGAPLNPLVSGALVGGEVDSTMHVPSQFRLLFRSMPDQVLIPGGLQLASLVTVTAPMDGVPTPLITGEITAVEVEHEEGEVLTIVRGMDRSHRLMRGTKTMAYPEMTASDVVTMLVAEATVIPGEIIPTENIYEWLTQANVSSWVFIQQLAALEGYVAYADAEGLFNFCPMPEPEAGEPPVLTYEMPAMGTQLVLGKNLRRMRAVVTSAEQVPAVTVSGYDPQLSIPVLGPFPTIPSTSQSLDPAVLPPAVAGEMGGTPFFDASRPFSDEGAAMSWSKSIGSRIAGALAEIEAECLGNPAILAGESITLGMAGLPFDGYYICTAARHVWDVEGGGYTTWVTVGGYEDRSLYALSSGTSATNTEQRPTIPGLVIGTVMMNEDPEEQGRVKVMFPWLNPSYVSAWARVMQIGASKAGAGFLWLPEVGDEVLIGFDRGSIDHPYVIGGLYNGVAMPIPPPSVQGVVANRRIVSRMLHTVEFDDGPEKMGISIMTAPPEASPASVVLDAEQMKITVNSLGQIEITGALDVKISATGGELTLDAPAINIGGEATASITIAGATVTVGGESAASVTVGGPASETSVSGSMVTLGPG